MLGAGRAAGADGADATEWTAINACLVPAASPRRPGGRHRRGTRRARRPAPGPARDGRARRVAVRLLHARGSCAAWPRSSTAPAGGDERPGPRRRTRPRRQRLRPPRAERQPVPLHGLPADQATRRTRSASRPPTTPLASRRTAPAPAAVRHPAATTPRPTFVRPDRSRRRWGCWPRNPTRRSSPAAPTGASTSTSRAPGPALVVAVDRLPELRGCRGRATTRSGSARP